MCSHGRPIDHGLRTYSNGSTAITTILRTAQLVGTTEYQDKG